MRAAISLQHATVFDRKLAGKGGVPRLMSDTQRHPLRNRDGAIAAGLRGVTGSLEVGMQADVLVLRADRPNVFPINDPIGAVVWGMDTSNVDWVFVGGRASCERASRRGRPTCAERWLASARRRMADGSGSSSVRHRG